MRYLVVTALLAILASCLTQSDEQIRADLEKTSSFTQELSVCVSSCDSPYNGVPVSCASNYGCYSDGDGAYCWQGSYWQDVNCVPGPVCGNYSCEAGENLSNCPQDCDYCGNGYCGPNESGGGCPQDCGGGCYYDSRGRWICTEIP